MVHRAKFVAFARVLFGLLAIPYCAHAQSSVVGRVLGAASRAPISGAEVRAPDLGLMAVTDSLGGFSLSGLATGRTALVIRAFGYLPESLLVELGASEALARDFTLRLAAASLAEVRVTAVPKHVGPAKLAGFEHRRSLQRGGRFLDREALRKWENRPSGDLFSTLPGVDVRRASSRAFAVGSRAAPSFLRDARQRPCYMDVYLDGVLVFTNTMPGVELFDLNTVPLTSVAAIEVYAGAAQMPPEFNRTSSGCGAVLIWTR
jgi:hypothetical protein